MFHRRSMLGCRNVACVVAVAIMLAPVATRAAADNVNETASVAPAVSANALPTRPIVGDDPVAIREALEKLHVKGASPSLSERVRGLIPAWPTSMARTPAAVNLDREVTFLVPVSYGLRYQSQKHLLKVNVDLVDPDGEGRTGILLRKVITGPRGRGRDRTRGEGKRLYPADRHHRPIPEKAEVHRARQREAVTRCVRASAGRVRVRSFRASGRT